MSSNNTNKITTLNLKLKLRLMLQLASHSFQNSISLLKLQIKLSNNSKSSINNKISNRTTSIKIITKEINRIIMVNTITKSKAILIFIKL
jgi:hypothetical protein